MNNIYKKIYEAVDTAIQKALIINDNPDNDVSVKWKEKEVSNEFIQYNPEMVDLGLPSGLLWAKYNLGAVPDENYESWYGNYYSWGETESKDIFSLKTYKY